MTISAKFAGECKVCGEGWEKGSTIYYSKTPRGICVTEECFNQQKQKSSTARPESAYRSITTVCPDVETPPKMKECFEEVVQAIAVVHPVIKKLYPDLDENTHTFGQIRSKLVDQLLTVYHHK